VSDGVKIDIGYSISGDCSLPSDTFFPPPFPSSSACQQRNVHLGAMRPPNDFILPIYFERVWDTLLAVQFPASPANRCNPVLECEFDCTNGSDGVMVRGVGPDSPYGAHQAALRLRTSGDGRLAARGVLHTARA